MLVLVGDYGKDQVPHLHTILTKSSETLERPNVLWCYKKDLGFSTHKKKRMKKLKRDQARGLVKESDNTFDLFCQQTDITWCYYKDSSRRVLGTTNGLLVLQDFEALTPNMLARTIETVRGGGLIVLLLRTVSSLKQLYTMSMDVHKRYRTEGSGDVVPRFNERFLLSLGKCTHCLVCDDELNVLPLSRRALNELDTNSVFKANGSKDVEELKQIKESLADTPHIGVLAGECKTLDQCRAVLLVLEACSAESNESNGAIDEQSNKVVCLTAARGRGKSASLGLSLAGALAFGYSNIVVTAPAPDNVVAVFEFILRGLKVLAYQEHLDYSVQYSSGGGKDQQSKCIVGISLHKSSHRQNIRYVSPDSSSQGAMATADIIAIDEAAAIPLPLVQGILNMGGKSKHNREMWNANRPRLYLLSSTVHGYEGTGRALSLKLVAELRQRGGARDLQMAQAAGEAVSGASSKKGEFKVHEQRWAAASQAAARNENKNGTSQLIEIELQTPIRYRSGDGIESWLNKLLCLDCGNSADLDLKGGAPAPADCELYHIDRDALFSYHSLSETFLQKLWGLYTSAHYKNSPNDLQMLSDAPSHQVYCLLSPSAEEESNSLPDILCVVQVSLEGKISRKAVQAQLARGHRSAGDLIPWTLSQQFSDASFASLSGARIIRIAVHPSVQGMGYGSRAVELLYRFFNGEMVSLANADDQDEEGDDDKNESEVENGEDEDGSGLLVERLKPRKELPPLLLPLTEVDAPGLDWMGTSFGLTLGLQKFWSRAGMKMLYLRQTKNELTGENSAIMVRALPRRTGVDDAWLGAFLGDVRRRLVSLLGGPFSDLDVRLALATLENVAVPMDALSANSIKSDELESFMTAHDLKRLEMYGRNLCDHHLVTDLLPGLACLYFTGRFGSEFSLSSVQSAVMCGLGLQRKTVEAIERELALPTQQVLAMFNKAIRKLSIALNGIVERREKALLENSGGKKVEMQRAADSMRHVTRQTLDEDVQEGANSAMKELNTKKAGSLPPQIAKDPELLQYAVKGTDEQWNRALDDRDEPSMIQISQVREKRKATEADIQRELQKAEKSQEKKQRTDKKKSKKRSRKSM